MDEQQLIERINTLLNLRLATLNPPTEKNLADTLQVTYKTVRLWRRGLAIGKSARAIVELTKDMSICPHSIEQQSA